MTTDLLRTYPPEDLRLKLTRLEAEFNDAEWNQEIERMTALDYEIRMARQKIAMGETHDYPF